MTDLPLAVSRAREQVTLSKPTTLSVDLAGFSLLFHRGVLIAVRSGQLIHFRCMPGAEQRAVNEWHEEDALLRVSSEQFDFVVGQVLTTAGLPLTQRGA